MTNSIDSNNTDKTSFAGDLKSTLAFSAVFPAFGAAKSVISNRGIKKAVSSLEVENFKKLNIALKDSNADVFTRGIKLSESYDIYKDVLKKNTKLANKAAKAAKKGDISLPQKFCNLFSKNKMSPEKLAASQKAAQKNLDIATSALKDGKMLSKTNSGDIVSIAANEAVKSSSTAQTVKRLAKSELTNKFVLGITVLGAIPRIKEEVIPAFKEKGFIEGIKTAGKVVARTGVDFISNAGFSAVGRAVGTALGSIVPGAGNAVGGLLGDAIGSCISMRLTNKIFDENKNEENIENKNRETEKNTASDKQKTNKTALNNSKDSLTGNPNLDKRINRALTI